MALRGRISSTGGGRPDRQPLAALREERRSVGEGHLASGTLACPRCDAPVHPGARALRPAERLGCPYCGLTGAVRDFLSLSTPTRPARVIVRLTFSGPVLNAQPEPGFSEPSGADL